MNHEIFNQEEIDAFNREITLEFAEKLLDKGWMGTRKDGNYTFPSWAKALYFCGVLFDPGSGELTDPGNVNADEKPCICSPKENDFPAIFYEDGEIREGRFSFTEGELQKSCYNCESEDI